MAFWTVIADYRGGTYISQLRAATPSKALTLWVKSFPQVRGCLVGPKTRRKWLAAVDGAEDPPVRIHGTLSVWYWNPGSMNPRVVVHLVKTFQC